MTKEEIFQNEVEIHPFNTYKEICIAAMDQYAQQVACGFADWLDQEEYCPTISEPLKWVIFSMMGEQDDPNYKDFTTSQLFDKYLDHLKTIEK